MAQRRWNLVQALNTQFWKRWRADYLLKMQKRTKWKRPSDNLEIGDIVVIKDDNYFQRSWPLAKVVPVYPGSDGRVRAVDVFTNGKTYSRPVAKLVKIWGEETLDAPAPKGENVQAN